MTQLNLHNAENEFPNKKIFLSFTSAFARFSWKSIVTIPRYTLYINILSLRIVGSDNTMAVNEMKVLLT